MGSGRLGEFAGPTCIRHTKHVSHSLNECMESIYSLVGAIIAYLRNLYLSACGCYTNWHKKLVAKKLVELSALTCVCASKWNFSKGGSCFIQVASHSKTIEADLQINSESICESAGKSMDYLSFCIVSAQTGVELKSYWQSSRSLA